MSPKKKSKLWGGRFGKKTDPAVEDYSNSIGFDRKLARYDCAGSLYHIDVLKKSGILNATEHRRLKGALTGILKDIENGTFSKKLDSSFEDIHSYIQHLVEKKAGKAAGKLHSCRSRNDQVVFATKLYCLAEIERTMELLDKLDGSLLKLSQKNKDVIIPGFTHLQHAMPVSLKSYFYAHHKMLTRDIVRLANAADNMELTFGAGALAGTMIPAARYRRKAGGLLPKPVKPTESPLDAVSDRDFVVETLSTLAIIGMHVSRLAEDMILWASQEFGYIDIDEAYCTGSSLMPQKKNPDVLELSRGATGRVYGNLVNVLVLMKGLPLSYNRDMQHDKEPLFDSFETVQTTLTVLTGLFAGIRFNKDRIARHLDDESLYATDIAEFLVKNKVPFKEAHVIVGRLVSVSLKTGTPLRAMNNKVLKAFHPVLSAKAIKKIIDPKASIGSKKSVINLK